MCVFFLMVFTNIPLKMIWLTSFFLHTNFQLLALALLLPGVHTVSCNLRKSPCGPIDLYSGTAVIAKKITSWLTLHTSSSWDTFLIWTNAFECPKPFLSPLFNACVVLLSCPAVNLLFTWRWIMWTHEKGRFKGEPTRSVLLPFEVSTSLRERVIALG